MFAHLSDTPTDGWTVDDLDALPEDGARRELIDGVLHVTPSPAPTHQVLAARLLVAMEENCPEHLHVSQANDVVLSTHKLISGEEVYKPVATFTETIELSEPWDIEIPIARLRPRYL
jgi:hypothetical protein